MAITASDVTYSSYFDYSLATKQIRFTDSTDFVTAGTVAANVTVVAKITAPVSGVIYNNTNHSAPDIDCGVSLDSIITIPLPLTGAGLPEQGLYTIQLTYVDSVVPATIVDTKTFTLDYTSPEIDIAIVGNCIQPLLSATDKTGYTRNYIVPTVTRAFQLNYPTSLAITPITGTGSMLTSSTLYTSSTESLLYTSTLTSTLSYLADATELTYIIDEVSGTKTTYISCDADLCDIYCCIRAQYQRWQDNIGVNNTQAMIELGKYTQIMAITEMLAIAIDCSKEDHVSAYVAKILEIGQCDAGCSCGDGSPQLVTGLGVAGAEVIVEAGTGLVVTPSVNGATTTYTVALSSTNVTKLANLKNTEFVDGSGISSVMVNTTVGGVSTDTWTVTATDTVVESLFVRAKITMKSSAVPAITITNQNKYGAAFATVNQAGTGTNLLTNNNEGSFVAWTTNVTDFDIANFFTTPADYYPEVYIVNVDKVGKGGITGWTDNLNVRVIEMSASTFTIRFTDSTGAAVNGLYLQDYDSIELIFKIHA